MPGRVRQSDIEELKAKADIVEVVGSYISLKTASGGSFKGLCPFHGEKTPSFNVRSNPAFYHCFGCGVGGDVYKFIQEIESLSFMDAVEKLAQKYNFALSYEEGGEDTSSRSRILALNQLAAEYYQAELGQNEGATAREFLVSRGFDAASANQFGIGYAPKGWQNLINHASSKGFELKELVLAGLAMESDKGGYDRFRGRVLWPIRDANSQVLGFGARKLYEDDQGPKYLNTPETPVYHKSGVLYGLDLARKGIVKKREVIVVEGYTDVMACHLAGYQTAVATCGTAFGEDHIRLINRLLGQSPDPASVIFTFDPDAAGQKAALKVYGDSNKFNALTFVAAGPDGLDPADLRQQRGDGAIAQMLDSKKPLFEFVIRHRISQFSLTDLDSRVAAARSAASVVAQISDPALRTGYTKQLADWVSLDAADVSRLVQGDQRAQIQQSVEPMRQAGNPKPPADGPQAKFERQVLEVLLQRPESFKFEQLERMAASGFTTAEYQAILETAVSLGDSLADAGFSNLLATKVEPSQLDLVRRLSLASLPATGESELAKYCKGVVNGALLQALNQEKVDLMAALRRIDPDQNPEAQSAISIQLMELESERRALMKL
jgi:DNA primase